MHGQTPRLLTLDLGLEWLKSAPLDDTQRRDIKSAVNTACRWFHKPPAEVPLDPVALRRLFKTVSPGKVGVTRGTFANVKWGIGRLLDLMGVGSRRAHQSPLAPEWVALAAKIDDPYAAVLLRRFGRYCSSRAIAPCCVGDAVTEDFLLSLERELRVGNPRHAHRETLRLWNRLAEFTPAWPQTHLTLPSYSRQYALDWDAFHPDLVEDLERYLAKQTTDDPFDLSAPIRGLKQSSIETYRDRLRRFASCVVLSGVKAEQLRSLADLVQPARIRRGLHYLAIERDRRQLAAVVAKLLAVVARVVGRPKKEIKAIEEIAGRLRSSRKGLSSKTRERLLPLKHEPNLARLFLFPTALARSLERKKDVSLQDAHLFQRALGLALLTVCPLRIGSLCSIRIDRHLNWSNGPMKGELTIEFTAGELKGDEPASFPIPREIANLIRIYCQRFRPLLGPQGSPFLFCGPDPTRPKTKECFSTQLRNLVFERLGLWVYPHLYRHIVHLVILRRFPGAYAMIARVLTHRSIATTIRNYSHFDAELSMRSYQRLVDDVKVGNTRQNAAEAAVVAYALERERPTYVGR